MNDDQMTLDYYDEPAATIEWLAERGHTALAIVPAPGTRPGVLFAKGNGTVRLARVGDTLVYDGKAVKVESA